MTVDGKDFTKKFTYSLALKGDKGDDGYNQATIYLYQRSSGTVSKPSNNVTYKFSTGATNPNGTTNLIPSGWSRTIPANDGNPCYVTTAVAFSYTDDDTIVPTDWSTPVVLAENGKDGRGITGITEHYVITNSTTAPADTDFGDTVQIPTADKPYLWNYETISYTSGNSDNTKKRIIGQYSKDGRSVTNVTNWYLATSLSSGVTDKTSGWTTSVQTVTATNKYLWNYEVVSFSSGDPVPTTPCIIGVYGVSVGGLKEVYYVSNSSSPPTKPTKPENIANNASTYNQWNYQCPTGTS